MANSAITYGLREALMDLQLGSAENVLEHQLTLTNLEPATEYFYQISSVDRSNNGPTQGPVLTFTTNADADLIPPAAPEGLASQPGSEAAWVTWTANEEEDLTGYNLYRQAADADVELVATSLAEPRFLDQGLSNGTTYSYQVTAVDNALPPNESVPSDLVESAPSQSNVASAPVADTTQTFGHTEGGKLTIANAVPVADALEADRETLTYSFLVSSDEAFSDVVAKTGLFTEGSGGTTSWPFERSLEEGTTYWWRARANDGLFDGLWSEPSSFLVEPPPDLIGDFNLDGVVNLTDFFLFADNFGATPADTGPELPIWDPVYDLDGDGQIDLDDFFRYADNFGKTAGSGKSTVVAAKEGDLLPVLKVVEIDQRYATLALEVDSPLLLQGYGALLRFPSGVRIQSTVQDARVRAEDGVQRLEGLLQVLPEQAWYGSYRIQGGPADGPERVFQGQFEMPPEAIGGEVTVEEVWAVDAQGQSIRMVGGPSVKLLPQVFALAYPYPNPFNPSVSLDYTLPERSEVKLVIFNVLGQKIRTLVNEMQTPGFYKAVWNGRDDRGIETASGVYFVRFEAGSFGRNRKVLMLK